MNTGALWAQRNPRERALLIVGAVVIAVAAYLLMTPEQGYKAGMLSSAAARAKYRDGLRQRELADDRIAALKPRVDTATYKDTSERVMPAVLKTLNEHAKLAGVRLREVKPLRPRRIGGVTKVTLTVRFTSEFRQVIPFVYHVEDPKGKLVVEKLNVSAPDPKSRQVDVEVQVALFTLEGAGEPGGGSKA